jgi:hypothetical protein
MTALGHGSMPIPGQPGPSHLLINAACLVEMKQMIIL